MNIKCSTGGRRIPSGVIIPGTIVRSSPRSDKVLESTLGNSWAVSPVLLAALCVVHGLWPEFSTKYPWVPFLTSLFFLGMPHGASDFARLDDFLGSARRSYRFLSFSAYLLGMGLVLLLSLLAPGLSLLGFVVVSVWHFGRSDLYPATIPFPSSLRLASRGLLLLSLPVAIQPGPVEELVNGWMAILGGQPMSESAWAQVTMIATVTAAFSVANSIIIIALFGLRGDFASSRREMFEIIVLGTTLVLLNPVFALGAYFLLWHSLRHLKIQGGREGFSFMRLRELCGLDRPRALLFLPTVAVYVGLSVLLFDSWTPNLQVALLLIFFAVVTPSHEILHAIIQRSGKLRQ